jgi:hypothetical protein
MAQRMHNADLMLRLATILVALLLIVPTAWARTGQRWDKLSEGAKQGIQLRRVVRSMQKSGQVRTAHPDVARRLSAELSKKLGRPVSIPARRIIQVTYDSSAHQQLKGALGNSVGVGIYPSPRWGHNKLRIGSVVTDSVPSGAKPFPSTNTRARVVPFGRMHKRYYEAVFTGDPSAVAAAEQKAHGLAGERAQRGMGCSSFVTKILREHLAATPGASYNGKLASLGKSESAAGKLWRNAAAASPAMIVVYSPQGDYRSVTNPSFKFDYTTKPGE